MQTTLIQRQYDEVIAPHYDLDPQGIIGRSLDRAINQIRRWLPVADATPLRVLDLGMGTGRFFEKLKPHVSQLQPYGIDLSQRMTDIARARIADLVAEVDDAANFDALFEPESFDLICTHFLTGFVPADVLAPKIWSRLADGGCWSLVGGTKTGFPGLQRKANVGLLKWLFGRPRWDVDKLVCNPTDGEELIHTLEGNGFAVRERETFAPRLRFSNLKEFMEFAYYGGWLTPFIEDMGLHRAKPLTRAVLNSFFFPVEDHHDIEIILVQKCSSEPDAVA
jgi:SAM-dependent methyltransferase